MFGLMQESMYMDKNSHNRYDILRNLALAGTSGSGLKDTARSALSQAAALLSLKAASVYLWDHDKVVSLAVTHEDSDESREKLQALEDQLFTGLRKERQLISAYMSFEGVPPIHSFTLPLRRAGKVFGAVIGIQEGEQTLVTENIFLEAFSAAVALNALADSDGSMDQEKLREVLDKERHGAIVETAVTVNHEINNPLTAILGNVQLLLMKRETLSEELQNKLTTIETAALQIQGVTQKLLKMTTPRTVEYADGTNMLDMSSDEEDNPES